MGPRLFEMHRRMERCSSTLLFLRAFSACFPHRPPRCMHAAMLLTAAAEREKTDDLETEILLAYSQRNPEQQGERPASRARPTAATHSDLAGLARLASAGCEQDLS